MKGLYDSLGRTMTLMTMIKLNLIVLAISLFQNTTITYGI